MVKTVPAQWHERLPEVAKVLVDAGYLHACQPRGTSHKVDAFLDFDEEQIRKGGQRGDSFAKIAAAAYSLLPWVNPASAELAARVVVDFEKMHEQVEVGAEILTWLMKEWNSSRLAEATGWPEYEVGQHVVDIDVVMGHRKSTPSPFIAHGYKLHRADSVDFVSLLHDVAGALYEIAPSGGGFYQGPMVWLDRKTDYAGSDIEIFLTPFDILNHGHPEEFLQRMRKVSGLVIRRRRGKSYMSNDAIPLFGVDEGEDFETELLQFLTPMWWDNQVFASVSAPCFLDGGFSWRIPFDTDKTTLHSKSFGQFNTVHALFWFATPEEHAAMVEP